MAWTDPEYHDWATGEIVSASNLDTYVRLNLEETAPDKVTTAGDMVYAIAAHALARLGIGTLNEALGGGASAPAWGQIISRQLAPTILEKRCTANVTGITSITDLTGATVTFTPDIASVGIAWAVFDMEQVGGGSSDVYHGYMDVDGGNQPAAVPYQPGGGFRSAQPGLWVFALTAAEHTVKLRAARTAGTGTLSIYHTNTKLVVWVVGAANVSEDSST